jgi:transposase
MDQEPYCSTRRVFWIVDNGSSHRGERVIVHTPTYASWLNQIEIYFSIIQPKLLKPNDYTSLEDLENALHASAKRYSALGKPFAWCSTRQDLERRLRELFAPPRSGDARHRRVTPGPAFPELTG